MAKRIREPEQYVYEVLVPVTEIWVMEVVAKNRTEAFEKASSGQGLQTCTLSGTEPKVTRLSKATREQREKGMP